MPKKKPLQPPQHPNGAWPAGLALNNAGFNELAAFLGCSNWFAGELVRHGELKVVRMGSRDVVRQSDAKQWLDHYVESEEYQQRLKDWLEKHPGEKTKMPIFESQIEVDYWIKFYCGLDLPKTERDWLLRKLELLEREENCRRRLDRGEPNPNGFYKPRSLKEIDKRRQKLLADLTTAIRAS